MAWVLSRLLPQLLKLFISHSSAFLTCTVFGQDDFLALPFSPALGLVPCFPQNSSVVPQEKVTEFTCVHHTSLGRGWGEGGGSSTGINPTWVKRQVIASTLGAWGGKEALKQAFAVTAGPAVQVGARLSDSASQLLLASWMLSSPSCKNLKEPKINL